MIWLNILNRYNKIINETKTMSQHIVKIKSIQKVTHDVLQIVTEKPSGYSFIPGQATDVSINHAEWKEEKLSLIHI